MFVRTPNQVPEGPGDARYAQYACSGEEICRETGKEGIFGSMRFSTTRQWVPTRNRYRSDPSSNSSHRVVLAAVATVPPLYVIDKGRVPARHNEVAATVTCPQHFRGLHQVPIETCNCSFYGPCSAFPRSGEVAWEIQSTRYTVWFLGGQHRVHSSKSRGNGFRVLILTLIGPCRSQQRW
ncbi:hypothetical protein GQ43DRAFT_292041 [Delitschia confertaspora ATCC 74209]|uniref:Uncharacterized protein n=1 Tax=Delitschia confertaspora ATCC 74209 TaxID=1513339 RepID=A0A9P4JRA8_9PLEO|nr:hypothetical protein GQ43DRAFT_292041 [Delitschia confertaspora ATCC 74209]